MSGYCQECGNQQCLCVEIETEKERIMSEPKTKYETAAKAMLDEQSDKPETVVIRISNWIMNYATQRHPSMMNQFTIEDFVSEEICKLERERNHYKSLLHEQNQRYSTDRVYVDKEWNQLREERNEARERGDYWKSTCTLYADERNELRKEKNKARELAEYWRDKWAVRIDSKTANKLPWEKE